VQDTRVFHRKLMARAVASTCVFGAFIGCGDDDTGVPSIETPADGGATVEEAGASGVASAVYVDAAAQSESLPNNDAATSDDAATSSAAVPSSVSPSASATSDAGRGETWALASEDVARTSTGGAETSAPNTDALDTSGEPYTSVPPDTTSTVSTNVESGPQSSNEVDAGPPPEPDATIVQTSEDFAGSVQGEGADGIDDALVSITLEGPIASLLIAEADDTWQIASGSYWWSQPGYSIPPAAPVLGGYTTEWNLFVNVDGYPHMTDRNLAPLAAGTHELEIYLSWEAASQPAYFVLVAFDDEGSIVSTSRLLY
jgi:hypothetical protein